MANVPRKQTQITPQATVQPQQTTTRGARMTASLYQGVIPPPDMMEHYNEIDPSFPGRILAMAEKEGDHRRAYDKSILKKSFSLDIVGNILGFLAVIAVAILAYFFMINGHADDGKAIAIGVMIGLATIFVLRKTWKKSSS
ncbi:MAG: DUF2335 domain-containing protein [Ferruginibacter sp.]